MKIQKSIQLVSAILAVSAIVFTSCQKQDSQETEVSTEVNEELYSEPSEDENMVLSSSDVIRDDINNFLTLGANGLKAGSHWQCNMTIDSTDVIDDTITYFITYDGLTCNERLNRVGQVQVRKEKGMCWWKAGAAVEVTYIDLQITRVATGKTIVLNGQETFENESGSIILLLGHGVSSVVHKVYGSLDVSFEDGTNRDWNIARQIIYTGEIHDLICTVDGFGAAGDYENLVVWGVNRQGKEFYTQIDESLVITEGCDWDAVSGVRIHNVPEIEKTITLTFGFNDNDEPIGDDECPTKFRLDWVEGNNFGTLFLPL